MSQSEKNLTAVFTDTANAIRAKKQSVEQISPLDFADEVASIETGITPTGTKTITTNGIHDVTQYASANVNVPSVQPTETTFFYWNNTYDVSGYANAEIFVVPTLTSVSFIEQLYGSDWNGSNPLLVHYDPICNLEHIAYKHDPSMSMDITCYWNECSSNPVDIHLLPGGHQISSDPIFVLGAVKQGDTPFDYVALSLNIEYANYTGDDTEEYRLELEREWEDYLYHLEIKDLNGVTYAHIHVEEVNVTFSSGC